MRSANSGIMAVVDDVSPAGRLLRLLALLQARRLWSGAELAERLGVTERTVRRDVDRLRALDYPVDGTTGTAGGYRLGSGGQLPPLLLDDDEAVAVAVGLARAGTAAVAGLDEGAARALAKLEHVLPARLRPQLAAVGAATSVVTGSQPAAVDASVLAVVAGCCRDREILTFEHTGRDAVTVRRVEPWATVSFRDRWYLVAFDPERDDWRSFRLDRVAAPRRTGRVAPERPQPAEDPASYLVQRFATARYRHTATLLVEAPATEVRAALYPSSVGDITDDGPERCTVHLSADSPELVARWIGAIAGSNDVVQIEADDSVSALLQRAAESLSRVQRSP